MGEERVFVATLSKLNRINQGNKFEIIGYKSLGLLAGLYSVVQKEQRIMPIKDPKNHPWNNHTKRFSLSILILLGQC